MFVYKFSMFLYIFYVFYFILDYFQLLYSVINFYIFHFGEKFIYFTSTYYDIGNIAELCHVDWTEI